MALGVMRLQFAFASIEAVLGAPLPLSAWKHRAWWANPRRPSSHPYSQSWLEARWVGPDGIVPVVSARQLLELAAVWDGVLPPPDLHLAAQDEALAAARKRLVEMQKAAEARERAGLERQLEAARGRLLRELGRTLCCLGAGDLDRLFHEQVQHEGRPDGRYHTALRLLGGYPVWTPDLVADAENFARNASAAQRKARVAGSELDAAIADPRWKALEALDR